MSTCINLINWKNAVYEPTNPGQPYDNGNRKVSLNGINDSFSRFQKGLRYLNLNLNSLLVKREIDNPSPGAVTGGN